MKKIATILLVKLMLLPVIWNGIGLLHYMVEHTHTFCTESSETHAHQTPADCLSLCQLAENHPNQQLPTTNDYQELKTCLTPNPFFNTLYLSPIKQTNFTELFSFDSYFASDIFQPPIG